MNLEVVDCDFTICKIDNIDKIDLTQKFIFLSKTSDEISLVCESSSIPPNIIESEPGWKAIKISDTLDFSIVGVLSKISAILASADISIFVISTYNTDYILMKSENLDKGIHVLKHNGIKIIIPL